MRPTPRPSVAAVLTAFVALATLAGPTAAPPSAGGPTGSSLDRGAPTVPFAAVPGGLPSDLTAEPDVDAPGLETGTPGRPSPAGMVTAGAPGRAGPPVSGLAALLRRGFLAGPTRAPPVPSH